MAREFSFETLQLHAGQELLIFKIACGYLFIRQLPAFEDAQEAEDLFALHVNLVISHSYYQSTVHYF